MNWIDKLERRFESWAIPKSCHLFNWNAGYRRCLLISERTSVDQLFLHEVL